MSEEQLPGGEFSVFQFFPNGHYERTLSESCARDAVKWATQLATSVGAKIGTTRRVIITDGWDHAVWEWRYGEGLVFPVVEQVPPTLQAHAPHEFDCIECGRHVVDVSGEVRERCACCIHVPLWYEDPTVARMLDPDHHRTRHEERQ